MITNVWLVRSPELQKQTFFDVFNLLDSIKGAFVFKTKEEGTDDESHERGDFKNPSSQFEPKSWDYFFGIANEFRKIHDLGDEEYVVVISDLNNNLNWFSGANYGGNKNLFIHSAGWDYFTKGSDVRYPIAYHIATTLLHHGWFKGENALWAKVHNDSKIPLGCINDFCGNKNEVNLKMRTGDICDSCIQDLLNEKVDQNKIKHILDIIGEISKFMRFSNKWKIDVKLPVLSIVGEKRSFGFPAYGNLKLRSDKASVQGRVLYEVIYLNQKKGTPVSMTDFLTMGDTFKEFKDAYLKSKGFNPGVVTEEHEKLTTSIENLCNRREDGKGLSQLIAKINEAFEDALGNDLAQNYTIQRTAIKGNQQAYIIGGNPQKLSLDHIEIQ